MLPYPVKTTTLASGLLCFDDRNRVDPVVPAQAQVHDRVGDRLVSQIAEFPQAAGGQDFVVAIPELGGQRLRESFVIFHDE